MLSLVRSGCMRPCTLWTITRTDGVVLRFTDHDTPIVIDDDGPFEPAAADVSARQKRAGLDGQNREFKGGLDSEKITHEDLASGRYRGATVLEQVIDWKYPWAGEYERAEYEITETSYSGETWSAQIDGLSIKLSRNVGRVYSRDCDARLGDVRCAKDLTAFTYASKAITTVLIDRLEFETDLSTSLANSWFASGKLTWLTGANAGLVCDVQDSRAAAGNIRLELAAPFVVEVGDTFTIVAGCDGNFSTCRDKFANTINHRGFPHQPGVNKVLKAPE